MTSIKRVRVTTAPKQLRAKGTTDGAEVEAAIAAGDVRGALVAALAWWRECRAPALAELVDVISSKVKIRSVSVDQNFTRLAHTNDPLVLASLTGGMPGAAASFLSTAASLLSTFDDPRVARTVGDYVSEPFNTSITRWSMWSKPIDAATKLGDVRVAQVFEARSRRRIPDPCESGRNDSDFWKRLYASVKVAAGKLRELDTPAVDRKRVARLASAARKLPELRVYLSDFGIAGDERPATVHPSTPTQQTHGGGALAQAQAHLDAGELASGIAAMVESWRGLRAPSLADAIDRASRMLPSFDRPLDRDDSAWFDLLHGDANAAMPQLLLNLHTGTVKQAEIRIDALGNLPDDPRVALRLAELAHGLHAGPDNSPYWISVFQLIVKIRDVRTVEPLAHAFGAFEAMTYNNHRQARKYLATFLATTHAPAISTLEAAAIARLDTTITKLEATHGHERALLAAIADDWDSDGPRLVYADWLQERDHPRGELLALATKATRSRAEAKRLEVLYRIPNIFGVRGEVQSDAQVRADRGLDQLVYIRRNAQTLQLRALANHPLAILLQEVVFDGAAPLGADLALLARNAPDLTSIGFEEAPALRLAGWRVRGKTLVRA